jgi:upstream activation factor subunit UAF30
MPSKAKQPTPPKKADTAKNAPANKASAPAAKRASPAEGTSGKEARAGKSSSGKKVNPALMKPLQPSNELAAVVGSKPLPRAEVVSKVWDYMYRPRFVRHRIESYAASAASESWFCRMAAGV